MTRTDKLKAIRDALVSVLPHSVFHYYAPAKRTDDYIVWGEDSSDDLKADGKTVEIGMTGTADLYTKTEYSQLVDSVESAFERIGVAYNINSVQFEDDTGYIHYEWEWTI